MATRVISGEVKGGSALARHLGEIEKRLGHGAALKVGFLSNATYPAEQAAADKDTSYAISGKNKAKRRAANLGATNSSGEALHVAQVAFWNEFGTTTKKGAVSTPSRPFFRTMIDRKSPRWGHALGFFLRSTKYRAEDAMALMGQRIQGDLRESITDWSDPPNAQSTIDRKGFNKPLEDTVLMLRSVDYQVLGGADGGGDD